MKYTVFLGGCPGVGKSFLAAQLALSGIRHEIAGRLIRNGIREQGAAYERLVVADADTADRFQLILIEQFRRIRSAYDGVLLLDGHFFVPTKEGPRPVSPAVFEALDVDVLFLIESTPETVVERLRGRGAQGWWDGTQESVSVLMNTELIHAEEVARALNRPLVRFQSSGVDAASEIRRLIPHGPSTDDGDNQPGNQS
jgi:adenylate kinase